MYRYNRNHVERLDEIRTLKELIANRQYYQENSENGLSILINGTWGSGKTRFAKDICDDEELKEKYNVITYDAFEYDFYDNPYIPFFSYLNDKLNTDIDIDRLANVACNQIGKQIFRYMYTALDAIIKLKFGDKFDKLKEVCDGINNELNNNNVAYEEFKKINELREKIKEQLTTKASEKSLILIIDELDRCKPTFAIGTLEIMKYFLDINNLIIILLLDEKQLQESVKTIYGQGMNSDVYFSKFFDYKMNLNRITFSQILDCSSVNKIPDIIPSVDYIFKTLDVSIRDGHKIFTEFLQKYERYCNATPWTKSQSVFVLFMLTLKNIDLMFFNSIIDGNFDNFRQAILQNGDIDRKKYLDILSFKLDKFTDCNIESCIGALKRYGSKTYIDVKYKEFIDVPGIKNFEQERGILERMNVFIPQLTIDATYITNLITLLN